MARAKTAWGIDIGQCALKALKLVDYGDGSDPQAEAFEIIEHPEILSQPDVDRAQLIRQSLGELLSRHNLSGSRIALSVPGQSSFTRFFRPPPVDPKGLPRIIQFEAGQQIPFPIDEVIWRWQAFEEEDSPELEVGIFAMKRLDVAEALAHLDAVGIAVNLVQVAPLALYNFMIYDEQPAPEGATLLVNIGADTTDLVVADGGKIWTRTIQIGGNNFTEALSKSFKLSFGKAETLKRTAATSKYARQVFQVMRPVFADFVQEIQRSVGYYISVHRESKFERLMGLGNGFRLPGLQKFLEQNLNIPVVRIDHYKNLTPAAGANVPLFNEGILSFAAAYGLAIQLLRPVPVSTNLLPEDIARRRLWAKKLPWFGATAAVLLLTLACPTYRSYVDRNALSDPGKMQRVEAIAGELREDRDSFNALKEAGVTERRQIEQYVNLQAYRNTLPSIHAFIGRTIRRVTSLEDRRALQEMLDLYVQAETDEVRSQAGGQIAQIAPAEHRQEVQPALDAYARASGEEGDQQQRELAFQQLFELTWQPDSVDVQRMLAEYVHAPDFASRQAIQARIQGNTHRDNRRVMYVWQIDCRYVRDVSAVGRPASSSSAVSTTRQVDGAGGGRQGFEVTLTASVPATSGDGQAKTIAMIDALDDISQQVVQDEDLASISIVSFVKQQQATSMSEAMPGGVRVGELHLMHDPYLPTEEMSDDMFFQVRWLIAVDDDGLSDIEEQGPTPGAAE